MILYVDGSSRGIGDGTARKPFRTISQAAAVEIGRAHV